MTRARAGTGCITGLAATLALASAGPPPGPAAAGGRLGVTVVGLRVDGRGDQPLGTDDPSPSLGWRIRQDLLQQDDQPGYGYFLRSAAANPGGLTTLPEDWNLGASKNHMILAQIEEWFHTGLAGIRAAGGAVAYRAEFLRTDDGYAVFRVKAGLYTFTSATR